MKKHELFKEARNIVIRDNNTSVSYLQRTLRVGYNTAVIIMEQLEKYNVVSKTNKDGVRKVISKDCNVGAN